VFTEIIFLFINEIEEQARRRVYFFAVGASNFAVACGPLNGGRKWDKTWTDRRRKGVKNGSVGVDKGGGESDPVNPNTGSGRIGYLAAGGPRVPATDALDQAGSGYRSPLRLPHVLHQEVHTPSLGPH
jgi:hypothetical protein